LAFVTTFTHPVANQAMVGELLSSRGVSPAAARTPKALVDAAGAVNTATFNW
jgi:hypothetical protein